MTSMEVKLFSRRIPIRTQDSEEHVSALVEYIETKAEEIDPDGKLPEMSLAILTMLNLADDLFKEKQRLRQIRDTVRAKTNFLLENMNQSEYVC